MSTVSRIAVYFLLGIIALLQPLLLTAQTYNFRNYSVEHGLPFINVAAIYHDSKGYLWSGAYGGLSRFDGKAFVNYSPKNGLANSSVTSITEDKQGNLWIGTLNGVSKLAGDTFTTFSEVQGLVHNFVNVVSTDSKGNVWFGTREGLSMFDGKKFTSWTTGDGLAGNDVLSICEDHTGGLWLGTSKGASHFSNGKFINHTVRQGLPDSLVKAIAEDSNGQIWFGTPRGACFLNRTTGTITLVDSKSGLPDNDVRCFAMKKNGESWVGTSKGIAKYRNGSLKTYSIGSGHNSNLVASMHSDMEGNLWIGTYSGLFRFRGEDFIHFGEKEGLSNTFIYPIVRDAREQLYVGTGGGGAYVNRNGFFQPAFGRAVLPGPNVTAAFKDTDGTMWFGTENGLTRYKDGQSRSFSRSDGMISNSVWSIMRDSKGLMWIGCKGGVSTFDGKKFEKYSLEVGKHDYDVSTILEDDKGNLWIGAYQGGLYLYDGKNFSDQAKKLGLKSNAYMSLLNDNEGNIYIGTFDGVFLYNGKSIAQFSEKDGLSSDLVYLMLFEKNQKTLWVGTNQGLNKIRIDEYKRSGRKVIDHYGKEEGFTGVECNLNGAYCDTDGSLWFGTVNGLIRYDPYAFEANLQPPKTHITGFQLSYRDTLLTDGNELPHDLTNLSINFIGICLTNPTKVKYKFMLEGLDKKWSPETQNTFASYSTIPPGKYRFLVKSSNNEGIWSETPVAFSFVIRPPAYKTWWFWMITTALLAIVIYFGFRYRVQQIRHRERRVLNQKIHLATNELKALRAQMNPHFMFNSLNSIQNFILSSDADAAVRYLGKFARLMRMILNNSERATVTIREELDALKLYLELEELRFEGKFVYSIEIDESIDQDYFEIPTMLIQPYVENAIMHGLMPKQRQGNLRVKMEMDKTHIICSITDDGIGRKRSMALKEKSARREHTSMGMRITRDRLTVLNYVHNFNLSVNITDLTIEDQQPAGTRIEIFIPIV